MRCRRKGFIAPTIRAGSTERARPFAKLIRRHAVPLGKEFGDGAVGLIDSDIRVCSGAGVGVGDGDMAKSLAANLVRSLACGPLRIEKRVVLVAVAMRPAIDGDGFDIAGGIEATGGK